VIIGGAVRNRTAVRNLATPNVYMFRKVVLSRLASHNLQSYARPVSKVRLELRQTQDISK